MGYALLDPIPQRGGTDWIWNDDSLRLVGVPRDAKFYVTDYSIADVDSGRLEFYSNGCHIYNDKNRIVTNGDSINAGMVWEDFCPNRGYPHSQGGLITDFRNTAGNIFYIVHGKADYYPAPNISAGSKFLLFSKAIIENSQFVLTTRDSIILDTLFHGGHLKSIKHQNGEDWWVIQPGRNDNRYFTFEMTKNGIDTSFTQTIANGGMSFGGDEGDGGGQATFSPNGKLYARFDRVYNGILIMDFNRESGILSNARRFHIDDELGERTGGCSFSPNSRFLYVSAISHIYQFDLEAEDIGASKTVVAEWDGFVDPFPTNYYLCNLGPDCRIYINSNNGVQSMHVIKYPDRKGLACEVAQHAIRMPAYNAGSMPNFPHYRIDEEWPCDSTIGVKLTTSITLPTERVEIQVSPNPAEDVLNLEYELTGINEMMFELFNSSGQRVYNNYLSFREFGLTVNIAHLPSGIYYWRLLSDEGAFTSGKVVIQ